MIPDLGALDAWRRLGGGSGSTTGGAASCVASESLMSPTLLGATLLVGNKHAIRTDVMCRNQAPPRPAPPPPPPRGDEVTGSSDARQVNLT